jgi:hypothetical protein
MDGRIPKFRGNVMPASARVDRTYKDINIRLGPSTLKMRALGFLETSGSNNPLKQVMSKKKGILWSILIYCKRNVIFSKQIENAQAFSEITHSHINERKTAS